MTPDWTSELGGAWLLQEVRYTDSRVMTTLVAMETTRHDATRLRGEQQTLLMATKHPTYQAWSPTSPPSDAWNTQGNAVYYEAKSDSLKSQAVRSLMADLTWEKTDRSSKRNWNNQKRTS